jgi:hypothetical protein
MVALRLAMAAPLLEADQEDQFTGEWAHKRHWHIYSF